MSGHVLKGVTIAEWHLPDASGAVPGSLSPMPAPSPFGGADPFAFIYSQLQNPSPQSLIVTRSAAVTPAAPALLTVTAVADTALTASTEVNDVLLDCSATRQFATGALTSQRNVLVKGATYTAVGASTITNAATVHVSGAPVASTNVTITNGCALWVQGGAAFGNMTTPATVLVNLAAGGSQIHLQVQPLAATALTASTELNDINFDLSHTQQWATGALALQRFTAFRAPTIGFVGASTCTQAATVAITAAPIAGTNATLTDSYALLVQAGRAAFGGPLCGNLAGLPLGITTFNFPSDADQTLTASQSANPVIKVTGTATARNLVITPVTGSVYFLNNSASGTVTLKASSGTGVSVATSRGAWMYWDGTNMVRMSADAVLT